MRDIYPEDCTMQFELGEDYTYVFTCHREQWGDNNHMMWLPSCHTEDVWNIDTTKAFRNSSACVRYMRLQIRKAIKDMNTRHFTDAH